MAWVGVDTEIPRRIGQLSGDGLDTALSRQVFHELQLNACF